MSEENVCPVCATENAPEAINCEVCGERLAPLRPGEELAPEESVAAMIQEEALQREADAAGAGLADMEHDGAALPEAPADGTQMGIDPVDEPISFYEEQAPSVLYSPLSGQAYERGTPEFAEGFGPMGEQLVTHPVAPPESESAPGDGEAVSLQEEDAAQAAPPLLDETPEEPEPQPAFQISGPNPAIELPTPGTHERPATLTLYHQKQPVLTYDIETDETLLGRRDIRADIHPDLDLAPYDPESFVSRKHAYIYRQNKNYTLYAISNAGLQLNSDLLELGDRRALKDGDVIVIAGFLALKFNQGQ